MTAAAPTPIEVRGLGVACALGLDLGSCVRALEAGAVRTVPLSIAGLEAPVEMPYYRIDDGEELFDPRRFASLSSCAAREAVESAGLERDELERTALFIGSSCFAVGDRDGGSEARRVVGLDPVAERVRSELGLGGEVMLFNTACTASAVALLSALRMLWTGACEHVLAMGIEICNRTTPAGFTGLQLVSDAVRPFDRRRNGIVLGEAVGAVVLSRRAGPFALRLLGGATRLDDYSVTTANPDGGSIAAVQVAALECARTDVRSVRGIKCHGTASPMNDTGEAAGIRRVFAAPPPICGLKPYVGHTLGACGAVELALFGGALEHGFVPATPGFAEEDPALGLRPTASVSRAERGAYLLNYFGFGGNNTSLVLEKR